MIPELKYLKNKNRILILGALGQIGSVLTKELRKIHGPSQCDCKRYQGRFF